MKYLIIQYGTFLERPNRFVARVLIDGAPEIVHVKNTGRCREILQAGVSVILEKAGHPGRKTLYSLIAAYKGTMLINIDSQSPNKVVYEAIKKGLLPEIGHCTRIVKEVVYGSSRFDIYYEKEAEQGFIEVKGVTLEQNGLALFPDAPTERGTKHVLEMIDAVKSGYKGWIFFLIQMKGPTRFQPNRAMDPKFAEALFLARKKGVKILAYDAIVLENGLDINFPIEVII